MKNPLKPQFLMAALFFCNFLVAQQPDSIYDFRQLPQAQQPQFPGGPTAYSDFVLSNFKYPSDAVSKNHEGSVVFSFVVEKDGSVSNVRVGQDIGGQSASEARRVARGFPKWAPGSLDGSPVRVKMEREVKFQFAGQAKGPEFPGGEAAVQRYFDEKLKCAGGETAQKNFVVRFIVKKNGTIIKAKIKGPGMDNPCALEAFRLVGAMPKWLPGTDGLEKKKRSQVVLRFTSGDGPPDRLTFPVRLRSDLYVKI